MSEKTVTQKLGLKADKTLLVLRHPTGTEKLLGEIPAGAQVVFKSAAPCPLVLLFCEDKASLVKNLGPSKRNLEIGGALWVAYYKGTSKIKTDINRDTIREYVTTLGLDTVAQIAIDEDWSALRLKVV